LYTSCVLWVAPLCAFSIYFTYQKNNILSLKIIDFDSLYVFTFF